MAAEPSKHCLINKSQDRHSVNGMAIVSREVIVQGPTLMVVKKPLRKAQESAKNL
jgi:hypothetical protein